jgi:hypothetical protein
MALDQDSVTGKLHQAIAKESLKEHEIEPRRIKLSTVKVSISHPPTGVAFLVLLSWYLPNPLSKTQHGQNK